MSKYTPWFSGDVKPARVGVYQRLYNCPPVSYYCHWNGKTWGFAEDLAGDCNPVKGGLGSPFQTKPWRGLAERAK